MSYAITQVLPLRNIDEHKLVEKARLLSSRARRASRSRFVLRCARRDCEESREARDTRNDVLGDFFNSPLTVGLLVQERPETIQNIDRHREYYRGIFLGSDFCQSLQIP